MAIRLIESHLTGVKLTQKDWHLLRESAVVAKGSPLSQSKASAEQKAASAQALARSLRCTERETEDFVARFSLTPNTEGTCDTLDSIAQNGIPAEIINRKRRNRGRPAADPSHPPINATNTDGCVVTQDVTPSGVIVDGVNQRIPLYRVTCRGRLVGVSLSKEAAKRIAEKFDANPRW